MFTRLKGVHIYIAPRTFPPIRCGMSQGHHDATYNIRLFLKFV